MRHQETNSSVFRVLNDKCWHFMPGIPIILSTAMWLTLTQPTGRNGQCEQLEFPVRWKFLASIISQFSPAYMCWNPLLGPVLCWVLWETRKWVRLRLHFYPLKNLCSFMSPFLVPPLVINFMWQNSNHRKEYIMKSNTHSPPIPVHYHFPGDKYVYQSFRYFLWDFVCLNIHTCLQIL